MKLRWRLTLACALVLTVIPAHPADGTFRGKVIDPPAGQPMIAGWIFVQGRNHMLRRVEVSHASIVFGEDVPASQRHKCNSECLSAGQEVLITAQQDSAGEWRAKRVEILQLTLHTAQDRLQARFTKLNGVFSAFYDIWITKGLVLCIAP